MDVEHLWFSSQPGGTATNTTSSLINQKEDGSDASEDQMVETLANMADKRLYKLVKWCKSLPLFKNIVVSALPSISYIVVVILQCSVIFSTIFRHLEANTCRNFELEED